MTGKERDSDIKENYAAWSVEESDYAGVASLVQWAVLAPSSHNTQPWKMIVENNSVTILPQLERRLKVSDPTQREMYISLGAAVANLKVAGHNFGWVSQENIETNNDGLASKTVSFKPGHMPSEEDKKLFHAITRRVSNRNPHEERPLPSQLRETLVKLGEESGLGVTLIEDGERKGVIGDLVAKGEEDTFSNPAFRNELAGWIKDDTTKDFEGMPTFGFVSNSLLGWGFLRSIRSGFGSWEIAARSGKLFREQTTAIGLISSLDNPEEWMKVGELFQLLALKAASMGISTNVMAVLVETGNYHKDLKQVSNLPNRIQMMFRIGYPSKETRHSPRYPASRVIDSINEELLQERGEYLKPQIFTISEEDGLEKIIKSLGEDVSIIDKYGDYWLPELFVSANPNINFTTIEGEQALAAYINKRNFVSDGAWVYYPWRRSLMHVFGEEEFYKLLYSRNFPSIAKEDQHALGSISVGIAGLSLGRNIAWALAMTGVKHLGLADFDTITPSNLGRMAGVSLFEIGENKTESLTRALYEFNPYLRLQPYPEGLNYSNLESFVRANDVLIDAMDAFPFKARLRSQAKMLGKIIIMGTDTAMFPIREVELPQYPAFGGRISKDAIDTLIKGPKDKKEASKMVAQVMGLKYLPGAVMANFINIDEDTQNYWSQLGMSAITVASEVAYAVYEIARGNADKLEPIKVIGLQQENLIDSAEEKKIRSKFQKAFDLKDITWWERTLRKLKRL